MEVILSDPDKYNYLAGLLEADSAELRDPMLILEELEEELDCSLIFLIIR